MELNRKISLSSGLFTTTMILIIGLIVYIQWMSTLKRQMELSAQDLAVTIADMGEVKYNLTRSNGAIPLQRLAEELKLSTRVQYIHILDTRGIYYAHTFPAQLGTREEDPFLLALLENSSSHSVVRSTESSRLPSVEAVVPVYYQGEFAGLVITGMLNGRVFQDIRLNLQSLLLFFILAVFISLFSSGKLADNIKKSMHGMEPREIARLLGQRAMTLENLKEGIVTIDQYGSIIYFNRSARTLTGLNDGDLNKPVHSFFFGDDYFTCLQKKKTMISELITPEGLTLQCRMEPIEERDSDSLLGVTMLFENLTEVRARAEELTGIRQMNEGLRAQNHEFLNKLHTISGMIELGEHKEAVQFINGISHNRQEMTAKLGRLIKEPSVAGLLLGKYNKAQELKIPFRLDEGSYLPEDSAKVDLINLVLGNLIENALDELKKSSDGALAVKISCESGRCLIEVSDNGKGIEDKEKAFEKGFSTKGEDRGLGLYLIKKNVLREGGEIRLETKPGHTVFTVILPGERRQKG